MALNTRVGDPSSDSFVTVTEADVILQAGPDDDSEWAGLTVAEKELRLRLAASAMSSLAFSGRRCYARQALCFPRGKWGCRTIPTEIKEAQAFIAYSVVHRGLLGRPVITAKGAVTGVKSVALGGMLAVTFGNQASTSVLDEMTASTQFPILMRLQRFLTQIRGGSVGEEPTWSTTTITTVSTTTTNCSTTTTTS